MNKLRLVCGTAFLGIAGVGWMAAQAPHNHEDPAGAGMGAGMKMGMMPGAMHLTVMTPFLLPELQTELGLSAQQVTQLRQLKQEMLTKAKDLSGKIAAKRKELDALVAPGTSKGEQVKKLLEQIANLKAEQLYTGYATTTKMKAALTEEQRTKFAAMKPQEFHEAMMSRMTMQDKMEMMPFMDGEEMMSMPGHGMMMQGEMKH